MNKQVTSDTARAAQQFMKHHQQGQFAVDALDIIIDAAVSHDAQKAQLGTHILFSYVVESLSDTFLLEDRKALEKTLAHLISRLRLLAQAKEFHQRLNQWDLNNEKDLLTRIKSIYRDKKFNPQSLGTVKKVFIPSRVTLGADVLLNILVIEKMKKRFPDAEIVFLGSEKNGSILKGNQPMVRVHPLLYNRRGPLVNRFLNWLPVIQALEEEIAELDQGEDYIIINTDSRLLQSGLLPIIPPAEEDKRYFSWKPAVCGETWKGTSQAEDLHQWLESTFGREPQGETMYPKLHFPDQDRAFANKVYEILNPTTRPFVVSMSFGVGGNPEKRVRNGSEAVSQFELGLILKLLADGVTIVLDKGFGSEEFEQAAAIIRAVRHKGIEAAEVTGENPGLIDSLKSRHVRLIAFQGTINKFAALIDLSDCYIGYDSLGQHLAAAICRDVITIFAGYHSDLFPERWKPLGKGRIRLVKAQCGPFTLDRQDALVDEVFELYKSLRKK
ncbi:MAG: glycosyltransferase family 9 protein [Candidatus Aminicenantes bacterium]|nr:MAG: glycosyltransferase family 9 protein [Candidatus Aminicenantes bacterium]